MRIAPVAGARARLAAVCLALIAAPSAYALTVNVDPVSGTLVPLNAAAGKTFHVSTTGLVDMSGLDGPYIVDPNGVIVTPPPVDAGSYGFWSGEKPVGAPVVGGFKLTPWCCSPIPAGVYGELIGEWTSGSWFVIGTKATIKSPANGSHLTLWVNDTNYIDNLGGFTASITPVPEPTIWVLMLVGSGAIGVAKRRSKRAYAAVEGFA